MEDQLEDFIKKRKRELSKKLYKNKPIDMAGFFLIKTPMGLHEIIIPGVKAFQENKQALRPYIKEKWKAYHQKGGYDLIAFVLESHVFMSMKAAPENISESERAAWGRKQAEELTYMPSDDPKAITGIGFWIYFQNTVVGYVYPYAWKGKHVVFQKAMDNFELEDFGNFGTTMFPHL